MKSIVKILIVLAMALVTYMCVTEKHPTVIDAPRPDGFPESIQVGDLSYTKAYQRMDSTEVYAIYYLDNVRSYAEEVLNDRYLAKEVRKVLEKRYTQSGVQLLPERNLRRLRLLWEPSCLRTSEYKAKKTVRAIVKSLKEEE